MRHITEKRDRNEDKERSYMMRRRKKNYCTQNYRLLNPDSR